METGKPTREEILANIRERNSGHLIEQIIGLEADKVMLGNEIRFLRFRIEELERELGEFKTVESK